MRFAWDPPKYRKNIQKHGIDFNDAKTMFDSPMLINVDKRMDYGEERWVGIGFLKGVIAVIVYLEDDEKEVIRIISVRKATTHEQSLFKAKIRN
jgi:uncharacterized protein